jgi:signal transduction histidine kinase
MASNLLAMIGEHEWRAIAFRQVSRLLLILLVPACLLALAVARVPEHDLLFFRVVILTLVGMVVVVAILSRDLRHYRSLAGLLVATFIAASLASTVMSGFGPGGAVGLVSCVVFVALFLGWRAVWVVAGVTTLLLLAIGVAFWDGLLRASDPRLLYDWTHLSTWVRVAAVYFAATTVAASTVAALIGRLEHAIVLESTARTAAERGRRRSEFLAEAGRVLGSSLDYQTTLRRVAELSTSVLGDYCVVDVLAQDGTIRRIAEGSGATGAQAERLKRLEAQGVSRAMLRLRSVVVERITAPMPNPAGEAAPPSIDDSEFFGFVRELGARSYVSVPMVCRGELVGALTLVLLNEEPLDPGDLASAEDLARRGAAAIDNGRLYEEAQRAIGIREEFLAIAAHELRTPVTSLRLAIQGLTRRSRQGKLEDPSSFKRMFEVAERQVVSLNGLIDTMLDVSSIASGTLPVVLADVDLAEAVRAAVALLAEPLRVSHSELTLDMSAPLVGRWDRSRLEQIVTNLLSNAIKYGMGRPIEIHAHEEDGFARLVVRDHGMGIRPEALERIFGPFERAVSLRNFGGLGLGLFIVKRIVDRLGGAVECASKLHEGATFTITLPHHGPREAALDSPQESPPRLHSRQREGDARAGRPDPRRGGASRGASLAARAQSDATSRKTDSR